jgi:Leucine-rich repeat (LRR) protein
MNATVVILVTCIGVPTGQLARHPGKLNRMQLPVNLTANFTLNPNFTALYDQQKSVMKNEMVEQITALTEGDIASVLQFKQSIHGINLTSWNASVPLIHWWGVSCKYGRVTQIDLQLTGATGTPDLTTLPSALQVLHLHGNQFTGTPNITRLPSTLSTLHLHDNQLTGHITLGSLPQTLQNLTLQSNEFTGISVDKSAARDSFPAHLDLSDNPWTISVATLPVWVIPLLP